MLTRLVEQDKEVQSRKTWTKHIKAFFGGPSALGAQVINCSSHMKMFPS